MCILFIYCGSNELESDYNLILVSNRDEFYDRPAQKLGPWIEDPTIYGGRDLEPGCEKGTWLSMSPKHKKLGVLLNLPGFHQEISKSRGKLVAYYMKSDVKLKNYIKHMRNYVKECNGFVMVTAEFENKTPVVQTYNNATDVIETWTDTFLGFSNNVPKSPLKKVVEGKKKLEYICCKYNKVSMKEKLIEELIKLLKSDEQHLPDPELERRRPVIYKELSSIFVKIPQARYGTRAHSIVLVTRDGHIDFIEISLQSPVDIDDPKWEKVQFKFHINSAASHI